jgi:hypothetical protein
LGHRAVVGVPPREQARDDEPSVDGSFVRSAFQELKLDPGPMNLGRILTEVGKLTRIRQFGLPPSPFAHVSPKVVQHYC